MPSSSTQVDELPMQMPRLGLLRRGHLIDAPPGAGEALDVGGGAGLGEVQQRGLVLGRGHAGQRPHLGVGDRAALHRGADARQGRQRVGDADLLAGGAEVDARCASAASARTTRSRCSSRCASSNSRSSTRSS